MLKVKPSDRDESYSRRTLDSLDRDLSLFKDRYGGNLKYAKNCNNVISTRFFNIPLSQVCVPGLHITLGVVLKFVKMFEQFCCLLDLKIYAKNMINNEEYNENFAHQIRCYTIGRKEI